MPVDYGRAYDEIQNAKQQEAARQAAKLRQLEEQQSVIDKQAGLELAKKMLDAIINEKKISFSIHDDNSSQFGGPNSANSYSAYVRDRDDSYAYFSYDGKEYFTEKRKLWSVKYKTCVDEMNRQLFSSGLRVRLSVRRDWSGTGSLWEFNIARIPPVVSIPSTPTPLGSLAKNKSKLPLVAMIIGIVSLVWLLLLEFVVSDLVNTGGSAVVVGLVCMLLATLAFFMGIRGLIKYADKAYSAIGALSGLASWVIVIILLQAA